MEAFLAYSAKIKMNNYLFIQQTTEIAVRFRKAIESCTLKELGVEFEKFPHGSCGSTSELLAYYLHEVTGKKSTYCLGTKTKKDDTEYTHAWLELNDLIIDITCDQFPDKSSIFVGINSKWHSHWAITKFHYDTLNFSNFNWCAYKQILVCY